MGKVIAVCTSQIRGVQKENRTEGWFEKDWGIRDDAHAGHWHRQVSLLSADKIADFNARGAGVAPGASEKIWWWRELISGAFLWEPGFAAGMSCWKSPR